MGVTIIEMVAYLAAHAVDYTPWRCVLCDVVSKHSEGEIMDHLAGHGLDKARLRTEKDGIFLYPEAG